MDSSLIEMSVEERNQILFGWNKTKSEYPHHKILPQLFEEQAENNSENIALIFKTEKISYHELNARANQIAHFLRKKGVKNNSLVAICMESSLDLIIGILGILKAGGAYLPLDPSNPSERQEIILADSEAEVIITKSKFTDYFKKVSAQLICLDSENRKITEQFVTNPKHINDPNNLAYVIYTSGSTGKPKGVMITHRNVVNFTHWFGKALAITEDDIFDFSSSISFDFAVSNALFPILKGAKIAICPETNKVDPYLYLEHLLETNASIIKITPSHFRQFKEVIFNEKKLPILKYIVFGGETLFVKDVKDWLEQFPNHTLFCEYGPTEATIATSWIKVNKQNIKNFTHKIPIGKPALNTRLYILNTNLQPMPIGVIGELYIGGDGVASGYLNHKEITEKKFIKDPFSNSVNARLYKTGDLCRYLPDGNIEFVERKDHQVKIRGFRVEMDEIEKCLAAHPSIKEAVITTWQDKENELDEKKLVAYCVSKNQSELNIQELKDYLHQHLPDYMVPNIFEILNALPLTPNGKLDRSHLPQPNLSLNHHEIPPHTKLERTLKNIWVETLHLNNINVDDNFFDLGGHSLSAARIISKIRKCLKKEIKLEDFYNEPTISGLATLIKKADASIEWQNNKNTSGDKKIPLNELQFMFWLIKLFYPRAKVINVLGRKQVCGKIDLDALNFALASVCIKHPILCYHVSHFIPIQYLQKIYKFKVIENDIKNLSNKEQEKELINSLVQLENYHWKKGFPLIAVKLFYLEENLSEIQIVLSHLISDEISAQLVFNDLSKFYLDYKTQPEINVVPDKIQYRDYIFHEKQILNRFLKRDILFWEKYLQDVPLLSFSSRYLNEHPPSSYTQYIEIPEQLLIKLQEFCITNRVSMADSLCAAVSSILVKYVANGNKTMIINFVRSTRENDIYDKTIGLFVRTDLIKINLSQASNLLEASKQVQKSIAEAAPYQSCPIIVKLAYLLKKNWEMKKIRIYMLDLFVKTYAMFFPKANLNPFILKMFGYVSLARTKKMFFLDVNIMNHFISNPDIDTLFGFKLKKLRMYERDKSIDKNVLNIWFDRNGHNKAYLIISGNLKSKYLQQIAHQIIDTLSFTSYKS